MGGCSRVTARVRLYNNGLERTGLSRHELRVRWKSGDLCSGGSIVNPPAAQAPRWAALAAMEKGKNEKASSLPNLDEFAVSRLH